ncbi:hypothetical protein EJ06DRAFT_528967 [Trichodelitschia bisporula]|uniref:Uncharacterized protein n=1 Tax=Trichodelitschia bisporula TaxID=703511 RepID=A0A6G1I120_9PEZI|nr:hypothetical protein EJ06DRAFT_528967 [Trichodelitschia bisporula]
MAADRDDGRYDYRVRDPVLLPAVRRSRASANLHQEGNLSPTFLSPTSASVSPNDLSLLADQLSNHSLAPDRRPSPRPRRPLCSRLLHAPPTSCPVPPTLCPVSPPYTPSGSPPPQCVQAVAPGSRLSYPLEHPSLAERLMSESAARSQAWTQDNIGLGLYTGSHDPLLEQQQQQNQHQQQQHQLHRCSSPPYNPSLSPTSQPHPHTQFSLQLDTGHITSHPAPLRTPQLPLPPLEIPSRPQSRSYSPSPLDSTPEDGEAIIPDANVPWASSITLPTPASLTYRRSRDPVPAGAQGWVQKSIRVRKARRKKSGSVKLALQASGQQHQQQPQQQQQQ